VSAKGEAALRCAGIQRFVDTYLDCEFGDRDRLEFETHLEGCEVCRAKVKAQAEWKRALKATAPREVAPAALRNRIQRAMAKEARPLGWRRWAVRAMPAATALGLLATFVVSKMSWSPVCADVIAKHQRNLPIEVTGGSDQIKRWYADKVDFPVRPPMFGAQVALRGGRLANIGDRQAAYLVYDDNGYKVSVFIFDPGELAIEAPRKARVGDREVYFDQERGYNVALFRDKGVGYAIASDLDSDQMLKLVAAAIAR
jgi:anti-sigma factor RsiW